MQTVTLPARTVKIGRRCIKVQSSGFERIDATVPQARAELAKAITRQCKYAFTQTYRRAADGTVFCLHYADGWKYDIFGEAHAQVGCPCTTMLCEDTYEATLAIMERHVKEYA